MTDKEERQPSRQEASVAMAEPLVLTETLANGILVTCRDISRTIAGDRWYVGLRCQASLPVAAGALPRENDPELAARIRRQLGEALCLTQTQEKHFVAQGDKDTALQECLHRVRDHLLPYLASPAFPAKFMAQQYEQARQRCLAAEQSRSDDSDAAEDGPADFSACFRD